MLRKNFILDIFCLLIFAPLIAHAIKCYQCSNRLPLTCPTVQTCGPDYQLSIQTTQERMACYGEKRSIIDSFMGYNTGCMPKKDCGSPGSIVGRRQSYNHHRQCCYSDYCNNELFGLTDVPRHSRGPHCYSCSYGRNYPKCTHITTCGTDQSCFIRHYTHSGHGRYVTGCMPKNTCPLLLQRPMCFGTQKTCCDSDFCNEKCVSANPSWTAITGAPTSRVLTTRLTTSTVARSTTSLTKRAPTSRVVTTRPTTTSVVSSTTSLTKRQKCLNKINDGFFYDSFSDICVRVTRDPTLLTQQQALNKCSSYGAELMTIKNRDEEDFLLSWIFSHAWNQTDFWIGAQTKVNGSQEYFWSDGSRVQYNNWGGYLMGQPDDRRTKNENCVFLNDKDRYFWHDDQCDNMKTGYICELWNITGPTDKVHACRKLLFSGYFYDQTTDMCVQFHQTSTPTYTHRQAHDACVQNGATLANLDTAEKTDFILRWIFANHENATDFWIGAQDIHNNSVFYWPNGHAINYSHWGGPVAPPLLHGQPDEHYGVTNQNCVYMDFVNNYFWFDEKCDSKKTGMICQLFEKNQSALADTCRHHLFDGYFYDAYAAMCVKLMSVPSGLDRQSAEQRCVQDGGHLAVIDSETRNNFILQWIFSNKANATDYWIGSKDLHNNGKFYWEPTGAPFSYTHWYTVATPPPENCVYMNNLDKYRWETSPCDDKISGYICQIV